MEEIKKNLKGVGGVIGVLAGKGGVGKSTVASGVAKALYSKGFKVGLLDADVYGPSCGHLFPSDTPPEVQGERVLPAKSGGVLTLSVAHFPRGKGPSVIRAPIATQIISQFIEEVEWGDLDFLLVDFPPGTGDIQISLMQKISFAGAVVITTPQELALLDVRKSMQMCVQMGLPLLGVVENMSYFSPTGSAEKHRLFGVGGGERLAQEFQVPLLAELPIDLELKGCDALSERIIFELEEEKGCKIKEEDRYHFSIEWVDGKKSLYRFSDVQCHCLCMQCDKASEQKPLANVEGKKITRVGRYGIQVVFSKGVLERDLSLFTFKGFR